MFSDEDLVFSDEEMGEGTDFFRENVGGGDFFVIRIGRRDVNL